MSSVIAPPASRRTVLTAIAVGPLAGVVACTGEPPPPPPPDPFEPLIAAAAAHAELADAVAAAYPDLAGAARQVAADRRVHADALSAEVRRATPSPVSSASPAGARVGGSIGSSALADKASAKTALLQASVSAQRQAAELVTALPRYRAGLVASVAASCASHAVVLA